MLGIHPAAVEIFAWNNLSVKASKNLNSPAATRVICQTCDFYVFGLWGIRVYSPHRGWEYGGLMMSLTGGAGNLRRNGEFADGCDRPHDFAWHRRYRSRRSVQLVDLAMVAAWAALIALVLLHR
jgi:hypothetical protein